MNRRLVLTGLLAAVSLPAVLATPSASGRQPGLRGGAAAPAAPRSAVASAQAETPCLTGDPYQLARLAEVIGSPTPPSAPITIGPGFVVQFVRAATMVDNQDDQMETGRDAGSTPSRPNRP